MQLRLIVIALALVGVITGGTEKGNSAMAATDGPCNMTAMMNSMTAPGGGGMHMQNMASPAMAQMEELMRTCTP